MTMFTIAYDSIAQIAQHHPGTGACHAQVMSCSARLPQGPMPLSYAADSAGHSHSSPERIKYTSFYEESRSLVIESNLPYFRNDLKSTVGTDLPLSTNKFLTHSNERSLNRH